jgi:hypothetical protein
MVGSYVRETAFCMVFTIVWKFTKGGDLVSHFVMTFVMAHTICEEVHQNRPHIPYRTRTHVSTTYQFPYHTGNVASARATTLKSNTDK